MGLEFQSRAFVYLNADEALEDDLDAFHFHWWKTGSQSQFRHCCTEGKWHAFSAARQVANQADTLTRSSGFFSLSADSCDAGPGYDRGYLLMDGFHEVNTRTVEQCDGTPPALFNHFSFCRHLQYDARVTSRFIDEHRLRLFGNAPSGNLAMAGWFYHHRPMPGFDTATSRLFDPLSVHISTVSDLHNQYLVYGDIGDVRSVISSWTDLSARFLSGAGLLSLIHPDHFDQVMFFQGSAYSLGQIRPEDLSFHPDIQFCTDRFGYAKR